jgi:hypothetical protein
MTKLLGAFFAIVFFTVGMANEVRADGWEVNNIWWNVILNYNNQPEDVCVTEQYNSQTLAAVTFDIYPAPGTTPTRPPYRHVQVTLRNMKPFTFYKVMGWITPYQTPVPPQCTLVSYQLVGAKRVRVRSRDVQKSSRMVWGTW